MATTPFPQDKYAFLCTGPTSANFVKDLEDVFEALTEYYNYPPGNVTVVRGSTAALPNVPGATLITITSVADLQTALANFAVAASGPTASGGSTTALLYFTGGGVTETSVSKLVIDDGPGTKNVDPPWLQARLNAFTACHLDVVMQQSFSGGFLSALTGSVLTQWSFTHASSASQDAYGNNTLGSFFTHGWVRGLKLEPLPAGTLNPGQYADQLGSAAQATNFLVSLGEAMDFGKQIHNQLGYGALSTPGYSEGGGPHFLQQQEGYSKPLSQARTTLKQEFLGAINRLYPAAHGLPSYSPKLENWQREFDRSFQTLTRYIHTLDVDTSTANRALATIMGTVVNFISTYQQLDKELQHTEDVCLGSFIQKLNLTIAEKEWKSLAQDAAQQF